MLPNLNDRHTIVLLSLQLYVVLIRSQASNSPEKLCLNITVEENILCYYQQKYIHLLLI